MAFLAPININDLLSVDGIESVRVDNNTEQPRVGLQNNRTSTMIGSQ